MAIVPQQIDKTINQNHVADCSTNKSTKLKCEIILGLITTIMMIILMTFVSV